MISKRDKIVVSVSGGPDSMCLLRILYKFQELLGFEIIVAHFDHGLRPEEDKKETEFVRDIAKKLNLTFVYGRPKTSIKSHGSSIEEKAREERHQFLKRTLKKHHCQKIALGHNMNDQAETVLIHFLRGSGATGLSGMAPISNGNYIRPLLFVTSDEIKTYLHQNSCLFMTDSSNVDRRYLRNKLRLDLIPQLLLYQPKLIQHLSNSAIVFRHEDELLEKQAQKALKEMIYESKTGKSLELSLNVLKNKSLPIRYRIIRQAIKMVKGNIRRIEYGHIIRIAGLLTNKRPQIEINLPEGLVVKKIYERLRFTFSDNETHPAEISYELQNTGKFYLKETGRNVVLEEIPKEEFTPYSVSEFVAFLELDKIKWPIRIRSLKKGDKFIPLGLKGFKKVKNILIDNKIPIEDRKKTIIFENNNDIIWIPGIRIDERYKIKTHTKRILRCAIE